MTIFMHPDKETASRTFVGDVETYQTGMAAIGVPSVSVSVSSGETFEVPEGYTGRVSSVRPVYLEERDESPWVRLSDLITDEMAKRIKHLFKPGDECSLGNN